MAFRILGINGSLTPPPSRTRVALDVALAGVRALDDAVETRVLELRDYALDFCDGRPPDTYSADTLRALAQVEEADAYIVATPVYRGSYTGALKNFFDLVPNDPRGSDPLRGKVVGLIATGGSDHHYLVLEHQLRPLFGFFGAQIPARVVYANGRDFDEHKQVTNALEAALTALGQDVLVQARFLTTVPDFRRGGNIRAQNNGNIHTK